MLRRTFPLVLLFLVSCSQVPPRVDTPDPVEREVSQNTAVLSLVKSADIARQKKAYEQAGADLERALNIEGKNADLWRLLALLKLDQGEAQQALVLLQKSNVLSAGNTVLQCENQRSLNVAYRKLKQTDKVRSDLPASCH